MTRRDRIILAVNISLVVLIVFCLFKVYEANAPDRLLHNDPNGYRACEDMVGVQVAYTTAPAVSHLLSASWFAAFSITPDIYGALQGRTAGLDPIVDADKLIRACKRHGFDIPPSNHH